MAATVPINATLALSQPVRFDRLKERGIRLRQPIIPPQFRAHWSVDLRDCNVAPLEDSQVWIIGRTVNLYETLGHVKRVTIKDHWNAVVILRNESEGTIFESRKGLSLSPDSETLTMRDEDDTYSVRFHRCHFRRGPR